MKSLERMAPLKGLFLVILSLVYAPFAHSADTADKMATMSDAMRPVYEALKKVELDTSRSAKVENFVIQRDITKITFVSGRVWFTKPWKEGAKPVGAWFSGEGRIQMVPPIPIEKESFKKRMEKESLDEKFTEAFIRTNDDLYDLLKDKIVPDASGGTEANRGFKERQEDLAGGGLGAEIPIINDTVTEGPRFVHFLMEFEMPKQGWIGFLYSPSGLPAEQMGESLYFKTEGGIITVFHDKAEYESGRDLGHEDRDPLWIRHYSGEIRVDKDGLLLKPKIDMEIESNFDGLRTLPMDFISGDEQHEVKVTALTDGAGKPLDYIHKGGNLLVVVPKALKKGERTKVHIEYTADYIRPDASIGAALDDPDVPPEIKSILKTKLSAILQDYATFTLLNTYPWFPQAGFLKRHTLDLTIKVPTPYLAVASGVTKKRWTEEGYNCLHTTETVPIALSSVLFGRYIMRSDTSARPAIHVYTLAKQQKQADDILEESRSIVTEYEKWFGPFPFDELDVSQMGFFYGFGQAPPGLVQLTGEAFLSGGELTDIFSTLSGNPLAGLDPSFLHAFLAHEIGHEWWGHAVSWANANDQWLSESYTEYCSALYVQSTQGQKAFDAKLKSWRDRASRAKSSGAIWLGGSRLGRHYTDQIYNKGPYVLHMFRLALQAQAVASGGKSEDGDKMFFDSLRNFIEKFRNQNATTVDFQKVVKTTTKIDMDWFFDQWFRGNNWLNLEFKYDVRPTEDGKFLLTANFKQPDKDNVKHMTIPMYIHLGKGTVIPKMIYVNKAEQVVQMKLPSNPEKVSLDDKKDLLADIKYN